jgi:hypothetical protein
LPGGSYVLAVFAPVFPSLLGPWPGLRRSRGFFVARGALSIRALAVARWRISSARPLGWPEPVRGLHISQLHEALNAPPKPSPLETHAHSPSCVPMAIPLERIASMLKIIATAMVSGLVVAMLMSIFAAFYLVVR